MWPSRTSKSTMPPPDQPLHPNGLPIPMTQTLTPSSLPLKLPQVFQPLLIPFADHDLDNTEPCESFAFDDSTIEHIMDTCPSSSFINKTHIFHVSKQFSSHYGSLIDRGANGGLAGSDVRICKRPVEVSLSLSTNHCKVVLVMHEYGYYGRGNTICSPGQLELFQNTCDDKSFHVGGNKLSTFLMDILLLSSVGQVSCI